MPHLTKQILKRITYVLLWPNSFQTQVTFLHMGGIDDFEYITFLKSEKNVYSQVKKCFQNVLLTVVLIGLSLKRHRYTSSEAGPASFKRG